MSNTQVILYLLALLLIYALAAKLDEQAASSMHLSLVKTVRTRCLPSPTHRTAPRADAAPASAVPHAAC